VTVQFLRFKGLSFKFAVAMTAVISGVAFTVGAVFMTLNWRHLQRELEEKALLLAHSVAMTAPEAILRNDNWFLYKSLKRLALQSSHERGITQIVTGMILDPDGHVLAHLRPGDNPLGLLLHEPDTTNAPTWPDIRNLRSPTVIARGDHLEGVVPIFADKLLLGVVRIRLSRTVLLAKAERSAWIIAGITLALAIAGSLLGAAISRRITKPLTAMTEGMEAVSRGELTNIAPVPVSDDDELGKLAATFNKMAVEMMEKKALEEQMAISSKLVALGRITAGVAHEVNNPLAGMLNCIDTLKNHPEDPSLTERYLPLLEKGLHRIRNIVESLLIELRTEGSNEQSSPSSLEELKDLVDAEINGRSIRFSWDNVLGEDIRINGRRVQQIVLNLLKNAIQAVPDGGAVSFRSYLDANWVILEIQDTGPGIAADIRDQLFDPFFTTKPNGTGLGLWIVYRMVESMRGVIQVESQPGKGTKFNVTLPVTAMST